MFCNMCGTSILLALCLVSLIFLFRMIYLVWQIKSGSTKYATEKRDLPIKTIICLGSGGHTSEMIKLIGSLDPDKYMPRYYIMANTDLVSETKIMTLEKNIFNNKTEKFHKIIKIPRSRVVKQSYFTSIFSTIYSILYCIPVVTRIKPELILCNGPGTCIPICLIAFIMKVFFICQTRIVFIESICRVQTFSLTGQILIYFADNIIVHWEELKNKCKRADYLGQLF